MTTEKNTTGTPTDLPPKGPAPTSMIPVKEEARELSPAGGGKDLYPGVATKPFEKDAQAILNREFKWDELEITPDGIVYAPAVRFRDRFDEAFGQGRWAMVRKTAWSDPRATGNTIMATFHLYVDQRYITEATGGQVYHPTNPRMTWDDAIEGATSNATMRVAKKLGVGRKLWDPNFRRAWRRENATRVWCTNEKPGQNGKFLWHRNDDPEAISWPWKRVGNAPVVQQPKPKGGAGGASSPPAPPTPPGPAPKGAGPRKPSPGSSSSTGDLFGTGPAPEDTGIGGKVLACSIKIVQPPQQIGDRRIYRFQIEDELGEESWVATDDDEKAGVVRDAFGKGEQVEMSFKDHPSGGRELVSVSPIMEG